jgi:Domain of unknown function (DUF3402)
MKIITSIYLKCRPDLRDEWLTITDIDNEVEDSLVNEFPSLVKGAAIPDISRSSRTSRLCARWSSFSTENIM